MTAHTYQRRENGDCQQIPNLQIAEEEAHNHHPQRSEHQNPLVVRKVHALSQAQNAEIDRPRLDGQVVVFGTHVAFDHMPDFKHGFETGIVRYHALHRQC